MSSTVVVFSYFFCWIQPGVTEGVTEGVTSLCGADMFSWSLSGFFLLLHIPPTPAFWVNSQFKSRCTITLTPGFFGGDRVIFFTSDGHVVCAQNATLVCFRTCDGAVLCNLEADFRLQLFFCVQAAPCFEYSPRSLIELRQIPLLIAEGKQQ